MVKSQQQVDAVALFYKAFAHSGYGVWKISFLTTAVRRQCKTLAAEKVAVCCVTHKATFELTVLWYMSFKSVDNVLCQYYDFLACVHFVLYLNSLIVWYSMYSTLTETFMAYAKQSENLPFGIQLSLRYCSEFLNVISLLLVILYFAFYRWITLIYILRSVLTIKYCQGWGNIFYLHKALT